MILSKGNKKLVALIMLFFGQIIISLSDINIPVNPESDVTSQSISRRLNNDISSFSAINESETMIRSFMEKWDIVGASIAIVKDERLIYAKGFGHTDTSGKENVQPRHLFRIASISKLITSVGIMQLVEEGKLQLQDQVFGPEGILNDSIYLDIKDPRVKNITIKHLLTHSAGWSKYSGDPIFMPYTIKNAMNVELPVDLRTTIQYTLENRSLDFMPGTISSYSNFGYAVLGEVIKEKTGYSYEQYITSEILYPLGINDMHMGRSKMEEKYGNEVKYYSNSRFKRSYSSFSEGKIVPRQYGGNNFDVMSAAGAWLASPAELLKLAVRIDGFEGKKDILSSESINKMTKHTNEINPMGWVSTDNQGNWKRSGSLTGSSALLKRQKDGITWVILLNTSNSKGHEFTDNLDTLMTQVINNVNKWPNYDLFAYSKPKPLYAYSESNY